MDFEEFVAKYPDYENTTAGVPERLVRTSTTAAILHPGPDTANSGRTLRVNALEAEADMTDEDNDRPSILPSFHIALPHYGAYRAFLFLEDKAAAGEQLALFNSIVKTGKAGIGKAVRGKSQWAWRTRDRG